MSLRLHRFLTPRSIAVVGASPDTSKIRGLLLQLLRKNGYSGRLYAVNPSYAEIDGLACYSSVAAIGEPIDLALIAIPAAQVLLALEECAAVGVRYVVIISSGFAEESNGKNQLQAQVAAIARTSGMRICGPNGEGFYNEIASVSATFSPAVDPAPGAERIIASTRRIGIIAQSGGIGFSLYQRGRAQGLSFSYVVSTGNEADLTVADFLDYMVDDDATAAVVLFLETVRDPAGFLDALARAADRRKPIVAVKVGRSPAGERAARSHTASIAGWDGAYAAVFKTHGVITVADPDEAIGVLAALMTSAAPEGARTCVLTSSGGAGVWVADTLVAAGLELPELAADLQSRIAALIPSYGSSRNPVDITAQVVHTAAFIEIIELLNTCDDIDLIVVVSSMARETRVGFDTAALKRIKAKGAKPMLFYSYTLPSLFARKILAETGIVIFTGLGVLARAMSGLVQHAQFRPSACPGWSEPAPSSLLPGPRGRLTEYESKLILADCGVSIARIALVRSPQELNPAAQLIGYPLVAKIQSRDVPHKTEIGGVRLDIGDEAALQAAYEAITAAALSRTADASIDGVLLEPMAPPGIEMIVGTLRDPLFGPVLMVGAGGITTELVKDVSFRLAPVSERGAQAMVSELRSTALLAGFRGAPRADIAALTRLIARISMFAVACRDQISEVELNPVLVHAEGQGCTIADAWICLAPVPGA